jgi:hypothetical protein
MVRARGESKINRACAGMRGRAAMIELALATAGPRARRRQAGGPPVLAVGQAEGNDGRPEEKSA